jgi:DNA-3-methyladenine glycosylase II
MKTLSIPRPIGFELSAADDFYRGFIPGSGMAASSRATAALTLSFRVDATFAPVVARLRQERDGLLIDVEGDVDDAALVQQIERMLGLEGDADAWRALGRREPHVGLLQRSFPGFFTAAKASPWDAATWAVIAPRMNMNQAARLKIAMARELGDAIRMDGAEHFIFPAPGVVAHLGEFPGLSDEKCARLRAVAEAALEGRLEAQRLRAMGELAALADLRTIRGIGPWAASHVYYRGAAPIDALPSAEPRILHGFAELTGEPVPTFADFEAIAERWRPFRMWVTVLLSRYLAKSGAWQKPGLARERESAGRELDARLRARGGQTNRRSPRGREARSS